MVSRNRSEVIVVYVVLIREVFMSAVLVFEFLFCLEERWLNE